MKPIFAAPLLLSLCVATSGHAQELRRLDRHVLLRSVQCELGTFADTLYSQAPQPMQRARVDIEMDDYKAKEISGGGGLFSIFANHQVGYEFSYSQKGGRPYNVYKDNTLACDDRNLVNLHLVSCFTDQIDDLRDPDGDASCSATLSGTKATKAGAKVDIWYVNLDASGAIKEKRTFKVDVKIPNKSR